MYKCNNCGECFEEAKAVRETHGFSDGMFEGLSVCPNCGGDYTEAVQCEKCGEWHFKDEIFGDFCTSCLEDEVDYSVAFDYMRETEDFFHLFMFERYFDSEMPTKISETLDDAMVFLFWRGVTDEKESGTDLILKSLKRYILEEDGDFGKSDFAEWLNERGCKDAD